MTISAIRSMSLPDLCQEFELTKIIKGLSKSSVKQQRLINLETNGELFRFFVRNNVFKDDMTSTEEDVSYPKQNLDYQTFPSTHTYVACIIYPN